MGSLKTNAMAQNTDKLLTSPQKRVMEAIIATGGGNISTIAKHLFVTYQCVANRLSEMYDDLGPDLGHNKTIQALVVWYYRTNFPRTIGAACLLGLFCFYTFAGGDFERAARRSSRRTRRNEVEYLIEV